MAELELQVPQQSEQPLGKRGFGAAGLGLGQDHEVDVAVRRHLAAPGAAKPDQSDALRTIFGDMVERQANDLVVEIGDGFGGGTAGRGVRGKALGDFGAALVECIAQDAGWVTLSQRGCDRAAVDDRPALPDVVEAHDARRRRAPSGHKALRAPRAGSVCRG